MGQLKNNTLKFRSSLLILKKTPEKILLTALRLFNEKGTSDITLRNIAQAAEMSQGNLNYHFKTKGDLIEALYFRLVEELNGVMSQTQVDAPSLLLMYQSGRAVMEKMYGYRFLLIDFVKIMQEFPRIRTHYQQLQQGRSQQFLFLFQRLIEEGLMRPPEFEREYERLYERMNILGDYWINAQLIQHPERELAYYLKLLLEGLYPYLTDQGKAAYRGLMGLKSESG